MESTPITKQNSPLFKTLVIALFCLACISAVANDEQQTTEETTDIEASTFAVLDTADAINDYRDQRQKESSESLKRSSLSTEHQELLATAMSKMYLGVPLSSFTYSERQESSEEEPMESTESLVVRDDGRIHHATESISYDLNTNNPFVSLPSVPFNADTGRVLEESGSEVTFGFDVSTEMVGMEDEDFGNFVARMEWIAEVVVNKQDQSPSRFALRLKKPVRQRFLFKLSKIETELHYAYIESCNGYAVHRMDMEMEVSAIFIGRIDEFVESTFTDIECTVPLIHLLPEQRDSGIFPFDSED